MHLDTKSTVLHHHRAVILRVSVCTLKLELFASSKLHIEFKHFQCACAYVCIELESFVFNYRHSFLYFFLLEKSYALHEYVFQELHQLKLKHKLWEKRRFYSRTKSFHAYFFHRGIQYILWMQEHFLGKESKSFRMKNEYLLVIPSLDLIMVSLRKKYTTEKLYRLKNGNIRSKLIYEPQNLKMFPSTYTQSSETKPKKELKIIDHPNQPSKKMN